MATTKEIYNVYTKQIGNYGSLPSLDVEILVDEPRFTVEGVPVTGVPHDTWGFTWVTADGKQVYNTNPKCGYCGATTPEFVSHHQHAYYDSVECSRCEGRAGWSIGD